MKNLFPGYYKKSDAEFKELWKSAVFAFDTNVLLDFFRYSDDTVEDLMATIEKVKDRIWLPFQVASEYHKLIYGIIGEQAGHYTTAIKDLNALRATLDAKRKHPFVSKEVYKKADEAFKALEKELKEKQEKVISLLNENPINEKLAVLFNNKVGEPFAEKEINELCMEGELRYTKLIPPGYEDAKKPTPEKFGDLIIWKQIIKYAKEVGKPVIFITGDTKSDWFLAESGRTIGPRPELLAEFSKETSQSFHSYPTTAFLKSANEFLSAGVKKATLDEVKSFGETSSRAILAPTNGPFYGGEGFRSVIQSNEMQEFLDLKSTNEILKNHITSLFKTRKGDDEIDRKFHVSLKNRIALAETLNKRANERSISGELLNQGMLLAKGETFKPSLDFLQLMFQLYSEREISLQLLNALLSLNDIE